MKLLVMMDAKVVSGPARQMLAVTPLLAEFGVETQFILASRGEQVTPFQQALEQLGRPIHRIHDRFPGDVRLLKQFRDVVESVRPDVLQTHSYRSNTLARLSRASHDCPWFAFFHGVTWENWKVRVYNRIDQWAMSEAERVVTVSQAQADALRAGLPKRAKIEVVANAVLLDANLLSPDDRRRRRRELGVDDEDFLLGVFGRLSREKGPDVFLESLAQVRRRQPRFKAILLGDGPMRSPLEQQAQRLGLESHVRFLGHQTDVVGHYSLLDALVLPSRSEGMPNVLLEAMSLNVPVVATRVGGVPEVSQDGVEALIVEPENPTSLAQALLRIREDEALRTRLVQNAFQRVHRQYSLASRAEKLRRMYEEATGR